MTATTLPSGRDLAPMKFDEVELGSIETYLRRAQYVLEQKLDGVRCMVVLRGGGVVFVTTGGRKLVHAASAVHFPALRAAFGELARQGVEMVVDGELIPSTGVLWLYDMPFGWSGTVDPSTSFAEWPEDLDWGDGEPTPTRREALEALFAAMVGSSMPGWGTTVRLTPQARTEGEKRHLWEQVLGRGLEGVMVKEVHSQYHSGKKVSHSVKVKPTRTIDAVVTARDVGGSKNAELALYDAAGRLVPVGGCSMIGKPDARPEHLWREGTLLAGRCAECGRVAPEGGVCRPHAVEVKFLYWTGERLYQPTLVRIREDDEKLDTECLVHQLPPPVCRDVVDWATGPPVSVPADPAPGAPVGLPGASGGLPDGTVPASVAVADARGSVMAEGLTPSPAAERAAQRFVAGETAAGEFVEEVLAEIIPIRRREETPVPEGAVRLVAVEAHYVDPSVNASKRYVAAWSHDGHGYTAWGRIGASLTAKSVGESKALKKLDEKLGEGYVVSDRWAADLTPEQLEGSPQSVVTLLLGSRR